MTPVAIRFLLSFAPGEDVDGPLSEALGEFQVSWFEAASGVTLYAERADAEAVGSALVAAGLTVLEREEEADRDWVAASAALRTAVVVGRYLLDPHDGERAAPAGSRRRIHLPAARAFGTGSHESTRIAVRLLAQEMVPGAVVLDVGCGAGTLAFVAARPPPPNSSGCFLCSLFSSLSLSPAVSRVSVSLLRGEKRASRGRCTAGVAVAAPAGSVAAGARRAHE